MSPTVTGARLVDVRFPTSRDLAGSDAMNPDPDYSAAYLIAETDDPELTGHGFVFTIGRGNDVQLGAIQALLPDLVGQDVDQLAADPGAFSRRLIYDSPLRWLGPEKGVMHMAIGAVVNTVWDLIARRAGLPLWRYLSTLSAEQLVDLIDFRYLSDALTPADALELLRAGESGRAERIAQLTERGYPAYTTGPGWLGYSDEKFLDLSRAAVVDGFDQVKVKIGRDLAEDRHRLAMVREALGPDVRIAVDANQRWDRQPAVEWINALAEFDLAWVEEPTSPDDVLALAEIRRQVAPIPIATGEHVQNRVIFKQLLQADALDVVQLDATRVGGVNENLAILLLAARFDKPVCPHAGGVGLCELVQHLAMFDAVAVSRTTTGRRLEYMDSLHAHFVEPAVITDGHYQVPHRPGTSAEIKPESLAEFAFPDGPVWR